MFVYLSISLLLSTSKLNKTLLKTKEAKLFVENFPLKPNTEIDFTLISPIGLCLWENWEKRREAEAVWLCECIMFTPDWNPLVGHGFRTIEKDDLIHLSLLHLYLKTKSREKDEIYSILFWLNDNINGRDKDRFIFW